MRRPLLHAGVLIACLLGAALGGGAGASAAGPRTTAPAPPPAAVQASIDRATVSRALPSSFLGLALEYPTVPEWVYGGGPRTQVDPLLVQLIRNLDPVGRPVLRIGGQSQDRAWWPIPGAQAPVGVTNSLSPNFTGAMKALASVLDARLILGLNLEAGSDTVTRYEATQLVNRIGRDHIDDLEIGNEPDLYRRTPWYRLADGRPIRWYEKTGTPVFSRDASWGQSEFVSEVEQLESQLPRNVRLAGPDAADARWLGTFSRLVSPGGRIGLLDSHRYPLEQCVTDPTSFHYPTIPNLLALRASRNILMGSSDYVGLAHRNHIPFRIDEMGSVTCNGHAGVSDTVAAALWVSDALFSAVRGGVDGVNLHSFPNSLNGLFDLSETGGAWSAVVHPLYDGALMFAKADPAGARLLRFRATDTAQVRTWATIGADHQVRVLLINVGGATNATVHAPAGFGSRPGSVMRMLTPGVTATTGVTIGGQTLSGTDLIPHPQLDAVTPGHGGYTLALPAASETLLTLRYRSRGH